MTESRQYSVQSNVYASLWRSLEVNVVARGTFEAPYTYTYYP